MRIDIIVNKIEKRIKELELWLDENGEDCKEKQSHLVDNLIERIYWHYGYMMALKDISRLINREIISLN